MSSLDEASAGPLHLQTPLFVQKYLALDLLPCQRQSLCIKCIEAPLHMYVLERHWPPDMLTYSALCYNRLNEISRGGPRWIHLPWLTCTVRPGYIGYWKLLHGVVLAFPATRSALFSSTSPGHCSLRAHSAEESAGRQIFSSKIASSAVRHWAKEMI